MKFSYKILLCTVIIMAVSFGASGYFFVNYVFQTSLQREVGQALDESNILVFAFETAVLNVPSRYGVLQNGTIEEIGATLEGGGHGRRRLRLSDEEQNTLYVSEGFTEDTVLRDRITEQDRVYQILQAGERRYIQTGVMVKELDRVLYLETMRDVTGVFEERARGFQVYRHVTLIMLFVAVVVMYVMAFWLTRPIRILKSAARRMTQGDYSVRAAVVSGDEMGQLTTDFNQMAGALEENVHKLENEVRSREDFIAAFSHELKTPLTAIIGYADLMRSRKLDEEKYFLSANYIYTEGKRLETMSFRLLDIIVTKRGQAQLQKAQVTQLVQYLQDMYGGCEEQKLVFQCDPAVVTMEADLIKSVLSNLIDNACKASKPGDTVEIRGEQKEDGYLFSVRDYGAGIPSQELHKITEAFYMVDKSRSRSCNGAGWGLRCVWKF